MASVPEALVKPRANLQGEFAIGDWRLAIEEPSIAIHEMVADSGHKPEALARGPALRNHSVNRYSPVVETDNSRSNRQSPIANPRCSLGVGLGLVCLVGCLATGCVHLNEMVAGVSAPAPPPCHMVVRWHNAVASLPDPVRGGAPGPGLVARVYLFGPSIDRPVEGHGILMVELFNPAEAGPDGRPKLIEKWMLSPEQLQQLERPDVIGCGYSLFLPWGTYRPDIAQVLLRACYQPKNGSPLYANSGLVTLADAVVSGPSAVGKKGTGSPLQQATDHGPRTPSLPPAPLPTPGRGAPQALTPVSAGFPQGPASTGAPIPGPLPRTSIPLTGPMPVPPGKGSPLPLPPGMQSMQVGRPGGGIVIDKGLGPWTK
jgi:hypothetical protein